MKVVFGCDPNATQFKLDLMEYVKSLGHEVADLGSDDPIYANTAIEVDVYKRQSFAFVIESRLAISVLSRKRLLPSISTIEGFWCL